MDRCETVTIVTKNGLVEINATDFDPKEHTIFTEEASRNSDAQSASRQKKHSDKSE